MFIVQLSLMVILGNIKKIKDNWPIYRCNPLFMGLSDNITEDFGYCVQNMQTDYFSVLIQPMNVIVGGLSSLGTTLNSNIAGISSTISDLRFNITDLFGGVFGMFENIIIIAEKLGFSLIDVIKRVIASLLVTAYGTMSAMDGVGSVANIIVYVGEGKINQVVCFSPQTLLTLQTNEKKKIKHIKLGDILENGSKIIGILKLTNKDYMYKSKINKNIYVTGKHYVQYNNKFIYVEEHPDFNKTNKICPIVYNLITDNHVIPIQEYLFWDYNDDILN